jgi:sugar lactone lactonase YvrE
MREQNMKTKHFRRLAGNLPGVLLWLAVLPLAAFGQANYATPYTFTTLAGDSGIGSADGTNSAARFAQPMGVAVDSAGNLYVGDDQNNTIRKVTPVGTNWVVTTLAGLAGVAGSEDGTGSNARFNDPGRVAVDTNGNVYVTDGGNNTIRKVTPAGVVTTLAGLAGSSGTNDGTGSAARFNYPRGVAVDSAGNLYVGDRDNDTIRKVTPDGTNWVVTTLAGLAGNGGSADGTNSTARFANPAGMAVDSAGNLYVADHGNSTIRKVTPDGTNWVVTTLAGLAGVTGSQNGTGSAARFNYPSSVAVDNAGNVYVADYANATIRKVTSAGVVTTLAGLAGNTGTNDGTGSAARFYWPQGVAVDSNGKVYVADTFNNTIREVTSAGVVTTLAGVAGCPGSADGTGSAARFNLPDGVAVDTNGNLYVADELNSTLRKVTPSGVVTTLAGLAGVTGSQNGTGSNARFNEPAGVAVDNAGNVYVADCNNSTIRKVTSAGVVTTLAGLAGVTGSQNGTGSNARFNYPAGVAVDNAGNVYVADYNNSTIRKVTSAGVVTTLAGLAGNAGSADGAGSAARFNGPADVAVDSAGNVYVADAGNNTIRKVTLVGATWEVTTLAGLAGSSGSADGTNSAAQFDYPCSLAVDLAGNVYVADAWNSTIREVAPVGTNWVVTTLAGWAGWAASADGTGSAAGFNNPFGVAVDSAGNLYVADTYSNTIRKGFPASSAAPMLQAPSLNAGQFGFGITGLTNLAVNIESSGDLSQWQVIGTCTLEGGTNYFVSPNPPQGAQFYRAHVR